MKVNSVKLKELMDAQNPLADLVVTGIAQFLGVTNGPVEITVPGGMTLFSPNQAMIDFLTELEILVPETAPDKEVLLHS